MLFLILFTSEVSTLQLVGGLALLLRLGTRLLGFREQFRLLLLNAFSLQLVNRFHDLFLCLVAVTFDKKVQLVVHVFVDFLGITVLLQETAQDTRATHPQDGLRQAGIPGASHFFFPPEAAAWVFSLPRAFFILFFVSFLP